MSAINNKALEISYNPFPMWLINITLEIHDIHDI